MTKREFYKAVVEANISEEMTNYATKAIEALDTTNAKRKDKKNAEQAETDTKVLSVMTADYALATDIAKAVNETYGLEGDNKYHTSRVVASCKRLEAEGKVNSVKNENGSRIVKSYALVESED